MSSRKAVPGKQNFGIYKYSGKKRDTYWVRREALGKEPLEQKLKSDNLNDARREADEHVRQWLGLAPKVKKVKLAKELSEDWIKTKADKSEATRYSIQNSMNHLMAFFGDLLPDEINQAGWEHYIQAKRDGAPFRRFFNDWKWFNMFLIYLHENGIIQKRPKLRNPDPKEKPGRVLSDDEVMALLANSNDSGLHLRILSSYQMGTRDQENKCLYWVPEYAGKKRSFVDFENRKIVLLGSDTKIRKGREFPITADVLDELSYLKKNALGVAVYPTADDPNERMARQSDKGAWARCRANAGVKCRFHDLRHTYLTNAFRNAKGAVDAMLICTAAGLSIEEAQSTYLHFNINDLRPVAGLVSFKTNDEQREKGGKNV